jgi:hypothetical protein
MRTKHFETAMRGPFGKAGFCRASSPGEKYAFGLTFPLLHGCLNAQVLVDV